MSGNKDEVEEGSLLNLRHMGIVAMMVDGISPFRMCRVILDLGEHPPSTQEVREVLRLLDIPGGEEGSGAEAEAGVEAEAEAGVEAEAETESAYSKLRSASKHVESPQGKADAKQERKTGTGKLKANPQPKPKTKGVVLSRQSSEEDLMQGVEPTTQTAIRKGEGSSSRLKNILTDTDDSASQATDSPSKGRGLASDRAAKAKPAGRAPAGRAPAKANELSPLKDPKLSQEAPPTTGPGGIPGNHIKKLWVDHVEKRSAEKSPGKVSGRSAGHDPEESPSPSTKKVNPRSGGQGSASGTQAKKVNARSGDQGSTSGTQAKKVNAGSGDQGSASGTQAKKRGWQNVLDV